MVQLSKSTVTVEIVMKPCMMFVLRFHEAQQSEFNAFIGLKKLTQA